MREATYRIVVFLTEKQIRKIVECLTAPAEEQERVLHHMSRDELGLIQQFLRAELAERGVVI